VAQVKLILSVKKQLELEIVFYVVMQLLKVLQIPS